MQQVSPGLPAAAPLARTSPVMAGLESIGVRGRRRGKRCPLPLRALRERRGVMRVRSRHEGKLCLRAFDEAHDAEIRRVANDRASGRIVGTRQHRVRGNRTPFTVDHDLVLPVLDAEIRLPAIRDRATRHAGAWLLQALKPRRQGHIGIWRGMRLRNAGQRPQCCECPDKQLHVFVPTMPQSAPDGRFSLRWKSAARGRDRARGTQLAEARNYAVPVRP